MKLRIHDNSIRLRLTRSEVARFSTAGRIEATLQFGPDPSQWLTYGLEAVPGAERIGVTGSAQHLIIRIPSAMAREWTGTERVSIAAQYSVHGLGPIELLVEKEFRRLHGANRNPDLYPNPLEQQLAEHRA